MNVSMKQKNDTKSRPEVQPAQAPSRRRRKAFADRLLERPELFEEFESILKLAEGGTEDGRVLSADEVEARLVEAVRKLGNRTMHSWAHQAQEHALEACKDEHPKARLKKKAR